MGGKRSYTVAHVILTAAVVSLIATTTNGVAEAAPKSSQPFGQSLVVYLPPAHDGDIPLYGPNERIEIIGGHAYLPGTEQMRNPFCIDKGGQDDPTRVMVAESAIVAVGPDREHRTDIAAFGNMNLGTSIGLTGPTGELTTGTYDVYYDECQDGAYDPLEDAYFPDAFRVLVPVDAPVVDLSATKREAERLQGHAGNVATAHEHYNTYRELTKDWGRIPGTERTARMSAALVSSEEGLPPQFGRVLSDYQRNLDLIAKDPPDPAYSQATVISPPERAMVQDGTAAEHDATVAVDAAARTAEALLHAMERYQGAAQARDGHWALVHAQQMASFARLLAGQQAQLQTTLAAFARELSAAKPIDPAATALPPTPFTPDLVRELRGLGLSPRQVTRIESRLRDAPPLTQPTGVAAPMGQLAGAGAGLASALTQLADQAAGVVRSLSGNPQVGAVPPAIGIAAPAQTPLGVPVTLTVTGGGTGGVYGWDLDGDGAFDDAAGTSARLDASMPGTAIPQVRTFDAGGDAVVAAAVVRVAAPPSTPATTSPAADVRTVGLGDVVSFSVSGGSGPNWTVDGDPVSGTTSFDYAPTDITEAGVHEITVTYTADQARRLSRTWLVAVSAPDADGDAWDANVDCDDTRSGSNPGATEVTGNGVDDDCSAATLDGGGTREAVTYSLEDADAEDRLVLNGSATWLPDRLRLTQHDLGGVVASAWLSAPLAPGESFTSTLDFEFTGPGGRPADGLALVVQSSEEGTAALGGGGGALGLSGIRPSAAVEFDTWDNGHGAGDENANHAAIDVDGELGSPLAVASLRSPLYNGGVHHARFEYEAAQRRLSAFLWTDGQPEPATPILVAPLDLSAQLGNDRPVHVGLVASTGGATQTADVLSWTFTGSGRVTSAPPTPTVGQLDLETLAGTPVTTRLTSSLAAASFHVERETRHGTLSISGDELIYTPDPHFTGTDRFSYTAVSDSGVVGPPATGVVSVLPAGTPPVLDPVPTLLGPVATAAVLARSEQPSTLRLTLSGLPGFVTLADLGRGNAVVSLDASRTDATPGTYTGEVIATDANGSSRTPVTVVVPGNAAPTVDSLTLQTPMGTPVGGVFAARDAEEDPLTATLRVPPRNGSVVQDGSTFVYTPHDGFAGTDGFIVDFSDGTTSRAAAAVVEVSEGPSVGADPGGGVEAKPRPTPASPPPSGPSPLPEVAAPVIPSPGSPADPPAPSASLSPGSEAAIGTSTDAPTVAVSGEGQGVVVVEAAPDAPPREASDARSWTGAAALRWALLSLTCVLFFFFLLLRRRRRSPESQEDESS